MSEVLWDVFGDFWPNILLCFDGEVQDLLLKHVERALFLVWGLHNLSLTQEVPTLLAVGLDPDNAT